MVTKIKYLALLLCVCTIKSNRCCTMYFSFTIIVILTQTGIFTTSSPQSQQEAVQSLLDWKGLKGQIVDHRPDVNDCGRACLTEFNGCFTDSLG